MKTLFSRQQRGFRQVPAPACRRLHRPMSVLFTGNTRPIIQARHSDISSPANNKEAGTIMLDVLVGLLIGTIGLCLVLGGIALTTWRAGYAKEDTLKIIQTRNERDKTSIFEIDSETFKKDE